MLISSNIYKDNITIINITVSRKSCGLSKYRLLKCTAYTRIRNLVDGA